MQIEKNAGYVLVSVIWICGLLAAAATSFTSYSQMTSVVTNVQSRTIVHNTILESAVHLGVAKYLTNSSSLSMMEIQCEWLDNVLINITVQDQAGLPDLNYMPQTFFTEMFKRLGLSEAEAIQQSGLLIDFRDVDRLDASGAPEPTTYANLNYGPKNAPFDSIVELAQLPDFTPSILRKLQRLTTVHAKQSGLDPTATPSALRLLFNESKDGAFVGFLSTFTGEVGRRVFSIDVESWQGQRPVASLHSVVTFSPNDKNMFQYIEYVEMPSSNILEASKAQQEKCFKL